MRITDTLNTSYDPTTTKTLELLKLGISLFSSALISTYLRVESRSHFLSTFCSLLLRKEKKFSPEHKSTIQTMEKKL